MFTGIVETMGEVIACDRRGELLELSVEAPEITPGTAIGDSVSVSGCCLTVTGVGAGRLRFQAMRETLDRTAIGGLASGARVNLERALAAGGRFGGHVVQGHVDATGTVRALDRRGDDVRLSIGCPPSFAEELVPKGSVAIDGVSLTVVGVEKDAFDVALIPHTLKVTTLGALRPGSRVNLEADVLGKYVKAHVERLLQAGGRP